MIISAIVATSENYVIGIDNDLPWRLPNDLKWFKKKTKGHHVIMGRTSFECLPKPLPHRVNIIITRDASYYHSGIVVKHSIDEALEFAHSEGEEEAFILGGGTVYHQTQELWDRLYLTRVHAEIEGDTRFPEVNMADWNVAFEEAHEPDERHEYGYTFYILDRKRSN